MKRNNERMAFAITIFLSIAVIISVFGASSNKLVLSASSNTTEQSSEAVETAASADTTSQAPTESSQTTVQEHFGDTSDQNSSVPPNHPDLIKHVNAGEYEEAFDYINRLKYGGTNTATKPNPWFSKDNIAILISVLAVLISLWHHFIDGVRNKKKDTLDAYNTLQQDAFDELNRIRKLYPKLYDDRSIEERTKVMGCLARIERFSVGIDSGVFDIGVLKKCGGAYFVRMYYYLEDIINGKQEPDRDRGGEHYNAFRKVKNQLEEEYEKEGTPITPFGLIKTKNLTLRYWKISDVDLLPDYAEDSKVQIDGLAEGKTDEERQRIIMSYFRGKEAYIITKKNDQNVTESTTNKVTKMLANLLLKICQCVTRTIELKTVGNNNSDEQDKKNDQNVIGTIELKTESNNNSDGQDENNDKIVTETIGTIELKTESNNNSDNQDNKSDNQDNKCKVCCWLKESKDKEPIDKESNEDYMLEAVNKILHHAYKDLGMQTVNIGPFKDKKEADSFIKKGGFTNMQVPENTDNSDDSGIYICVIPKND